MKITSGIILIFLLTGLIGFYMLGGFAPIQVEIQNVPALKLTGYYYKGTPQNKQLGDMFKAVEGLKNENPNAILHTIYYVEPTGKADTLEVFVGLDQEIDTDGDMQTRTWPSAQAIVASLQKHRFVMPSPEKVKERIQEYAKQHQLQQPTIFIDRIISEGHVQVIAYTTK
jgi:hypothetical protein